MLTLVVLALSLLLVHSLRVPTHSSAGRVGQLSMLAVGDTPPDFELVSHRVVRRCCKSAAAVVQGKQGAALYLQEQEAGGGLLLPRRQLPRVHQGGLRVREEVSGARGRSSSLSVVQGSRLQGEGGGGVRHQQRLC